ncbi:MAG: HlyD family type I secretion periplasmic adaptor subunit [Pseudomonadota bacterium]
MTANNKDVPNNTDTYALTPAQIRARNIAMLKSDIDNGSALFVRLSLILVCSAVLSFAAWSTIVELEEIAVAPGEIIPSSSVISVEHLEGGIVSEIHVSNGQAIQQGNPIVTIDGSAAKAELDQMHSRIRALDSRKARLRALANTDFSVSTTDYSTDLGSEFEVLMAQKNAHQSERKIISQQLRERNALLVAKLSERKNIVESVELLKEELDMRAELHAKHTASKLDLIKVKERHVKEKAELSRVQGDIETTRSEIAEFKQRVSDLDTQMRDKMLQQISQIEAERAEIEELIRGLEDRVTRLVVTSPISGLIQNLTLSSAGQVISPGGLVSEIVPLNEDLFVDAEVSTGDIGHVAVGDAVNVKLDAYNFARHGAIDGEVESISPTTYVEENKSPYYKTRIRLASQHLGPDPDRFRLIPGMTVQADINTGSKTLFQYLMKPLYTALDESFRER